MFCFCITLISNYNRRFIIGKNAAKKAEEYNSDKIKNKWLNELRYIPLPEIKNFLNYKINILEKINANIELFISEQLSTINPKNFDVTDINKINTIIGVLIDNIIEAIQLSKEKIVSINIYIHNQPLIISS